MNFDGDYRYINNNNNYYASVADPDEEHTNLESSSSSCSEGHRSSLNLQTPEGGSICLTCFSNLITNPSSPTFHVSYALSQLSHALSRPSFLDSVLSFHSHLLVSPLVQALSSFQDERIATQVIHLVLHLCDSARDEDLFSGFVARISDKCSSRSLSWTRSQLHMLHCLGFLMNNQNFSPYAHIRDKQALVSNLITGLQLPSEEIRGEIFFLLYKISIFQYASKDGDDTEEFDACCPMLLRLSLEILMKTQSDAVRLNCIAFLIVLAQRGYFGEAFSNDVRSIISYEADNFNQPREETIDELPLSSLFAESIKGPLLSADSQVQISALNLTFHYLSSEPAPGKQIQALLEENIADYVFEILRLSESKDPVVTSCVLVLNILATAEHTFRQRLAIGFPTLIPVLHYVAEVPFHPVQSQTLNLVSNCVSDCPGILSSSIIEELGLILKRMLHKHIDGEMGMPPETFNFVCSIFVALIKSPSSDESAKLASSLGEATNDAVLVSLSASNEQPRQLLHSLYLLKEAYAYGHEVSSDGSSKMELRSSILDLCKTHLVPWLLTNINQMEEEGVLGTLETFHSVLLQDSVIESTEFATILISSSWYSFSFECLGLFPTENIKWRVYLLLSSIIDVLQENDYGQVIRDAVLLLPSDPMELLYLLEQKSTHNAELTSCQSAILLILHFSTLYNERLADDKLVLASLEQYILVNNSNFLYGVAECSTMWQLVNLYGLYRGLAKLNYQIPYRPEAEKIIFQLMNEKEWDISSIGIHPRALKWFFQQDKIRKPLSNQILKFCRYNSSVGNHVIVHGNNSRNLDVQMIADMIVAADSHGAMLLVCLLAELVEEEGNEEDIISVVNLMENIVDSLPSTSNQFCLHGIGNSILISYIHTSQSSSRQTSISILRLTFKILQSVNPAIYSDDGAWVKLTMKLMEYLISTMDAEKWTEEIIYVVGILSLILHQSTIGAFPEASKIILMNKSLISMISNQIHATCSKGALTHDRDGNNSMGKSLILTLFLCYFSFRSLHVVLPGVVDWGKLFGSTKGREPFPVISINCLDLCRLMHFGSPAIKLVSSYCLLELVTRILDQADGISSTGHLASIVAVLEGLVFYSDIRVAMNSALCLSMILGWDKLEIQEVKRIVKNNWCRLIVEELAMSLTVPSFASQSFMNHHRSAVHVAVALLKMKNDPVWMRSVLNETYISGLLDNLSVNNVSAEMVLLFQELLNSSYLNDTQIASLNQILQACRRRINTGNTEDDNTEGSLDQIVIAEDDPEKVCEYLVQLMTSQTSLNVDSGESKCGKMRLIQEIDKFLTMTDEKDGQ